jgi:thiopeptide-type bacteriocin biosynthesis protein
MAIAHDAFDRDSRDAMRYEAMSEDQRRGVSRVILSVAISSHLFRHTLEDRAEIWDVWQRLQRVTENATAGRETEAVSPGELEAVARGTAPDLANLAPEMRRLLDVRLEHNIELGRAVVAARDAGRLTVGLRAWLTALTIFHWNRIGVTLRPDELAAAVAGLCRVLEPES